MNLTSVKTWAQGHRIDIAIGVACAVLGFAGGMRCNRPPPAQPKVEVKKVETTTATVSTDAQQAKEQTRVVQRAPVVRERFAAPSAPGAPPVLIERVTTGPVVETSSSTTATTVGVQENSTTHSEEQHTVTPPPAPRVSPLAISYTGWFDSVGLPSEHTVGLDVPVGKVPLLGLPLRAGLAAQFRPNGEKNLTGPLKAMGVSARIEF